MRIASFRQESSSFSFARRLGILLVGALAFLSRIHNSLCLPIWEAISQHSAGGKSWREVLKRFPGHVAVRSSNQRRSRTLSSPKGWTPRLQKKKQLTTSASSLTDLFFKVLNYGKAERVGFRDVCRCWENPALIFMRKVICVWLTSVHYWWRKRENLLYTHFDCRLVFNYFKLLVTEFFKAIAKKPFASLNVMHTP